MSSGLSQAQSHTSAPEKHPSGNTGSDAAIDIQIRHFEGAINCQARGVEFTIASGNIYADQPVCGVLEQSPETTKRMVNMTMCKDARNTSLTNVTYVIAAGNIYNFENNEERNDVAQSFHTSRPLVKKDD